MRPFLLALAVALSTLTTFPAAQQNQLRVFIRSGPKSHGPGAHDHPRFFKDWVPLLNARGARATGADAFPTKAQLDETDVLILHAQEAGNIPDADGPQEPRGVPRARRRAGDDSRRLGLARSRLVPDDRRRLVAQRHDEVARRADAPLLHRSRRPDHQGRVQLVDGRRDLLRHGPDAGRRACWRRRIRRRPRAAGTPARSGARRSSPAAASA